MNTYLIQKVKDYCKNLLLKSRCKDLQFHNYQHTLYVAQNADRILLKSGLREEDREIILISAYFHDSGYIETSNQHELLSCSIARRFLERQNYPEEKIKKIEHIILATQVDQEPTNLLEEIICDADLSHLGEKTFLTQNKFLREEWSKFSGIIFTDEEWLNINIKFLNEHHFYTEAAHNMFSKQKYNNILEIKTKGLSMR